MNNEKMMKDYQLFARSEHGISSTKLNGYKSFTNSMINPLIIEERQMNVAAMDVFSRLMADRIIFLGTEIDYDVANIVASQLMYLDTTDNSSDIKLFINTPGGIVEGGGLQIYDVMKYIESDVATYNMGLAASMGSILLSSGTQGKRYALPHSKVMIHQPMGGVHGGTQESDFRIAYEQIKDCKDTLYKILAENTGKSIEEITVDADRDCWLKAHECTPGVYGNLGLIDEIIQKER